jgi:arginyl-tRNA--protein-N-Asp/Glu arginylyltransferase
MDMTGTQGTDLIFINEEFYADAVTPVQIDMLLAGGWRHFGPHFFRYSLGVYEEEIRKVIPLRVQLERYKLSKSQRRILRNNADLETAIKPVEITDETHDLFERHKSRFKSGVPATIYDFLSSETAGGPTDMLEVSVRRDGKLLAASFFDIGETAISSIYGIFDPEERDRSLGIFTMLTEIEYALANGKTLYYHGYAYDGPSYYDYKKRFSALEAFDWNGNWLTFLPE